MLGWQSTSAHLGWETFLFFSTGGSFGPRVRDVRQAKGTATCILLSSQEKDCSAVSPSIACGCQMEHCVSTLLLKLLCDLIFASLTRDPKCILPKVSSPACGNRIANCAGTGGSHSSHSLGFRCKLNQLEALFSFSPQRHTFLHIFP